MSYMLDVENYDNPDQKPVYTPIKRDRVPAPEGLYSRYKDFGESSDYVRTGDKSRIGVLPEQLLMDKMVNDSGDLDTALDDLEDFQRYSLKDRRPEPRRDQEDEPLVTNSEQHLKYFNSGNRYGEKRPYLPEAFLYDQFPEQQTVLGANNNIIMENSAARLKGRERFFGSDADNSTMGDNGFRPGEAQELNRRLRQDAAKRAIFSNDSEDSILYSNSGNAHANYAIINNIMGDKRINGISDQISVEKFKRSNFVKPALYKESIPDQLLSSSITQATKQRRYDTCQTFFVDRTSELGDSKVLPRLSKFAKIMELAYNGKEARFYTGTDSYLPSQKTNSTQRRNEDIDTGRQRFNIRNDSLLQSQKAQGVTVGNKIVKPTNYANIHSDSLLSSSKKQTPKKYKDISTVDIRSIAIKHGNNHEGLLHNQATITPKKLCDNAKPRMDKHHRMEAFLRSQNVSCVQKKQHESKSGLDQYMQMDGLLQQHRHANPTFQDKRTSMNHVVRSRATEEYEDDGELEN